MKALYLLTLFLAGCGLVPQKVSVTDPEVQSLFSQARIFPRENYGFSPLPTDNKTDIRIERHSRGAYDVIKILLGDTPDAVRKSLGEPTMIIRNQFREPNRVKLSELPEFDEQWGYRENMANNWVYFKNGRLVAAFREASDF